MCRFTLYLGPPLRMAELVTEPVHSLIRQSKQSRERVEPMNADGFGVAWWAPALSDRPAVYRSIQPAWNDRNLEDLARVIESQCILAHVRAATAGSSISEDNCHPFRRGPIAFMHNGELGGIARVRRPLLKNLSDASFESIRGTTDSEVIFAVFLDRLTACKETDPAEALRTATRETLGEVSRLARELVPDANNTMNLALADGANAVVTRFTDGTDDTAQSLYVNSGRRLVCRDGQSRMLEPERGEGAVVVSSERLSDDPGWVPVPVNHMVVVRADRSVEIEPCI